MTIATLLNIPDDPAGRNAFAFEHAMATRQPLQVMGPLSQWSALPYFIAPMDYTAPPGTNWHLNHQQAHNDFLSYLPAYWGQTYASWRASPGIPSNQPMLDSNLSDPGGRKWFTFLNHQEHYTANSAILPLPLARMAPPPATFALPWWLQAPRLAATFW